MKVNVLSPTGKKLKTLTLPQEIFAAPINQPLMAQAVRVYLTNQRQGTKKVKTRGEVRGSRRKIWRQKGTGRARHGDRYAPIFVGGGVAHGPTGQENYRLKLSKKMRRRALFSALTTKAQNKQVIVVSGLEKIEPKTKKMATALKKIAAYPTTKKITLILPGKEENINRASQNLSGVSLQLARQLNTYQVLNGGKLIFLEPSLKVLQDTFS
jgi:large subunit ribosomal protein L4